MATDLHADAAQRQATYQRLAARNKVVSALRWAVPTLGVLTLVGLIGQIYLSSLGNRFSIGQVSVTREAISIAAPEYAGVLPDGSTYRVWADTAEAATGATNLIGLTDAALTMNRSTGITMQVNAPQAMLDTTSERVIIEDIAYVEDSTGTAGTVHDSVFDYATQTLTGEGDVEIDYADGTQLVARGMTYDAEGLIWTFSNAKVTLPSTPGADP
ncbi:hypothetical protein [Devosia sp. RR2S18]|uniref:hypothetical protein n=1 Tax=Devosia rhizosphaerae TaxID=3049774 RepID=UPI0025400256|nr:hypothetical protein [Devosia sp. RR2S18]WIJ25277.1 hypothetical protein QOV41_00435 [Devosia sp. RR2S18]